MVIIVNNPGGLCHRIEIWHFIKTGKTNDIGADEVMEEMLMKRWAKLESRTGSLLTGRAADTVLSKTTHKITIRYNPDINYSCWIMYAGRRFDIDYINDPHLNKRYLELFVQEVV